MTIRRRLALFEPPCSLVGTDSARLFKPTIYGRRQKSRQLATSRCEEIGFRARTQTRLASVQSDRIHKPRRLRRSCGMRQLRLELKRSHADRRVRALTSRSCAVFSCLCVCGVCSVAYLLGGGRGNTERTSPLPSWRDANFFAFIV